MNITFLCGRRKCPRIVSRQWAIIIALLLNIILLYYFAFIHHGTLDNIVQNKPAVARHARDTQAQPVVTFIYRDFELYENKVLESVNSVLEFADSEIVLVVADDVIYPPLNIKRHKNVRQLGQLVQFGNNISQTRPESYINTEYVMVMPDNVKITYDFNINTLIRVYHKKEWKVLILPIDQSRELSCKNASFTVHKWTLNFSSVDSGACSFPSGLFAVFMKTADFLSLPSPFSRPMFHSLFIQTSQRNWHVHLVRHSKTIFTTIGQLYNEPHSQWKHKTKQFSRKKSLYKELGVKLVQLEDGQEEWYGCSKESQRCFGTVVNDMPDYLYRGKWTPPCCLKALRLTTQHVVKVLESQGIRYWLEGGSLLGAARGGDIIPWDYDVDLGVYLPDVDKCKQLSSAKQEAFEDESGFVWEKAREGDFYRVQYSQSNRLHVDIFPFYTKDGNMTKDTWMKTHKQDMPFPEKFLQPMEKLKFVGMDVSVPNNYRDFLELKFGKGVIESPKYPNHVKV